MRRRFPAFLPPWSALGLALLLSTAACSGNISSKDGEIDAAGDAGPDRPIFPDTTVTDVQRPECEKNEDCDGGVCVGNRCCPDAERACGDQCCATDQVCFANACVKPGAICFSAGDCDPGEYCEPTLGPDGGAPVDGGAGGDGGVCLQPQPSAGRCLALPPRCAGDGGATDGGVDGPPCLPPCEFHPTAGQLTAEIEWRWGVDTVSEHPDFLDVWSTPVVGRVTDTNCDGEVDELDPPNVIFISGNAEGTYCSNSAHKAGMCQTGVLRVLDGASGQEIWSLRKASPTSKGFMGMSIAIGDVDGDGFVDIVAITGEGYVVLVDRNGQVLRTSDQVVPGTDTNGFGWGGGLAIADMNNDGLPEIAYGRTVFTTPGDTISFLFTGDAGSGGAANRALSIFADLDVDGTQELVVGNAAYRYDGSKLWHNTTVGDGYPAVGDFNGDGKPDVAKTSGGQLWVLEGKTGAVLAGPLTLAGSGTAGPPTVADFDGDGQPEVGVAMADFYSVIEVDLVQGTLSERWHQVNHDFSSSVTGSTVFDFEGDGSAEVIYNDECFLWVYDGKTGDVRFATPTTSFTATEASLVADVDGDGRAEMVMIANGASPTSWHCDEEPWTSPDPALNRPAWAPPPGQTAFRGITVWGDKANSWVGTRTLWNQHSYHVSNICDSRDTACKPQYNSYGAIPAQEKANWTVPWLNNFRQNVQDEGIFDAPDATVTLRVQCTSPLTLKATVRNLGLALLPAGVEVGFYVRESSDRLLATDSTASQLFPGQGTEVSYQLQPADNAGVTDTFIAKIITDPQNPTFNECRADNNESEPVKPSCLR